MARIVQAGNDREMRVQPRARRLQIQTNLLPMGHELNCPAASDSFVPHELHAAWYEHTTEHGNSLLTNCTYPCLRIRQEFKNLEIRKLAHRFSLGASMKVRMHLKC